MTNSSTSAFVRAEPLRHQVRTRYEQDIRQESDKDKETWGDVMIRCLWDHQIDSIIDVKLGDDDTGTNKYKPMTALLTRWEKIKKENYGKHCRDQQKKIAVCSISGRNAIREALVVLSQLS